MEVVLPENEAECYQQITNYVRHAILWLRVAHTLMGPFSDNI